MLVLLYNQQTWHLTDEKNYPDNVIWKFEIQDVLEHLKSITNQQDFMAIRVIMTHSLQYMLKWQRVNFLRNVA